MIITQEELIQRISDTEDINTATVRKVFQSAENLISNCLSSVVPDEDVTIKPFSGMSINRKYVERRTYTKGMFQGIDCPEHVKLKASVSKYYTQQLNQRLFDSNTTNN